jgi:hypothetical protein
VDGNDDEDGLDVEDGRYMLPLVDMLNHCAGRQAATTLRFDPQTATFSMVAERDIPAGASVEHSYGVGLTDAQLALSYGFTLLGSGAGAGAEYRCSVDLPLPLLRSAARSLYSPSAAAAAGDWMCSLRRSALRQAGLGGLCGDGDRPSSPAAGGGDCCEGLGLLLESNWVELRALTDRDDNGDRDNGDSTSDYGDDDDDDDD